MTRSIYRFTTAAITAAVLQFPSTASADVTDQKNDECLYATELISYAAPLGQTFKPTQGLLIAAELRLSGMNGKPPTGDITLNVRDGGALDGTILGSAMVSGVTLPRDVLEWVAFEFEFKGVAK